MSVYPLDCIVAASSWPESVRELFEFRLINRFQYLLEDTLYHFVLKSRDAQSAHLPIPFGYIGSAYRIGLIGKLLHPYYQVFNIFL